jgi:hypothetical protein
MSTLPALPPSIAAVRLQAATVQATERDLETKFLGNDLDEICAVAIAAADPVFLASAALPLENRRVAVIHWRKKQVAEILRLSDFNGFIESAEAEQAAAIRSGEVPLAEVHAMAEAWRAEVVQRRNAAMTASKEAMRAAIHSALQDGGDTVEGAALPGFLAILETGEVGLFRRRAACLDWARAAGCRFFLGVMDRSSHRIFRGLED